MSRPADSLADFDRGVGLQQLRRTALWVLVVQCLLALSWTMYVVFLPGLLMQAGIEKRWFVYVLIADQLIFAACDWLAGMHADRLAVARKRLGRVITTTTLLSSALLLAMPWIALTGSASLLLATIFLWAASSSALRAPVFALLGRVRGSEGGAARAGMVSMALVGITLAGAISPYLAMLLKNVDNRLPIALSAISLALAGLWATRADAILPQLAADTVGPPLRDQNVRSRAWTLAAIVLIAAFGTQVVTGLVATPLYQRFVGTAAVLWVAWFWAGFGLGLIPGTRIAARNPLIGAAAALVVALIAFGFAEHANAIEVLVLATIVAGAGWGVFTTAAFSCAVSLSSGRATVRGAGTASGLVFSAIAIATFARLAILAVGQARASYVAWLPQLAWAIAAVLLVLTSFTIWKRGADQTMAPLTGR